MNELVRGGVLKRRKNLAEYLNSLNVRFFVILIPSVISVIFKDNYENTRHVTLANLIFDAETVQGKKSSAEISNIYRQALSITNISRLDLATFHRK